MTTEDFTNDDYETPDDIAKAMANLVIATDRNILEPFAGTGQIVKYLPSDRIIDVVEIKRIRIEKMLLGVLNFNSICNMDFFDLDCETRKYDLIITNPPFSLCMEAISHSLKLLNPDNPNSRLLFLIPLDTFASQGRSEKLKNLDAHIHHTHLIPRRIDYLKDGEPMSKCQKTVNGIPQFKNGKPIKNSGRQCYDAVFDIRLGKEQATTTFLI